MVLKSFDRERFCFLLKLCLNPETRPTGLWFLLGKEKFGLKFKHNLTSESLVLDIGAYEGNFASRIYDKFHCTVQMYEPVPDYLSKCLKISEKNPDKIKVNAYALGGKSEKLLFNIAGDASGFNIMAKSESSLLVDVVSVTDEFARMNKIDLVKINIEGAEYDLLENLISSNQILKADSYLIQFHNFYTDSRIRREKIQDQLRINFKQVWNFDFVWELWRKKS